MKYIAYCVTDSGIDGREPEQILYASKSPHARTVLLEKDKSRQWRQKKELVVDHDKAVEKALSKLDGIDRLVLGLPAWPSKKI